MFSSHLHWKRWTQERMVSALVHPQGCGPVPMPLLALPPVLHASLRWRACVRLHAGLCKLFVLR